MVEFGEAHAEVRSQIAAWLLEAEEADWKTPAEIRDRFGGASFLDDNRVVFNLKGKKYRLLVKVDYTRSIVIAQKIGTHAEYSKWAL